MVKQYNKIYIKKNGDVYVDTPLGRVTMTDAGDHIYLKTSGNPIIRFSLLETMYEEIQSPTYDDYDD